MKTVTRNFTLALLLVVCGLVLSACGEQSSDVPLPPKVNDQSSVPQLPLEANSQSSVATLLQETAADHMSEPLSAEIKAHRYSGDLNKLEEDLLAAGYMKLNGMMVKGGDATHPYHSSDNVAAEEWCILDTSKRPVVAKRCVYAVQSIIHRDSKGRATFQTDDALEFAPVSGYKFLDDDTNCESPLYPYRTIVAIGRFILREGRGNGGYAEDIRQAWVIDIESKKFVEISTKEVTCEVNEDRD